MLLGRPASVRLLLDRRVDAASVHCTIRLIEETVEVSYQRHGKNSRQYVFNQLCEEKFNVSLAPGMDGRQTARVEFQLPEGDYSTRLSGDEPRYRLFEAQAARRRESISTRASFCPFMPPPGMCSSVHIGIG